MCVSLANDSTVTASDMRMHHVIIILTLICSLCFNAINSSGPEYLTDLLKIIHLDISIHLLTLVCCTFHLDTPKHMASAPFPTLPLFSGTIHQKEYDILKQLPLLNLLCFICIIDRLCVCVQTWHDGRLMHGNKLILTTLTLTLKTFIWLDLLFILHLG